MAQLTDLTPDAPCDAPVALVLPGVGYTVHAPLLYWSIGILLDGGWRVTAVDWIDVDREHDSPESLIERTLHTATAEAGTQLDLIVAKSLGSLALPHSIDQGIPGVWLTPLLNRVSVAAALSLADHRHLAVGGTADRHWMPDAVASTGADLLEVPGADHSLRHTNWRRSLEVQVGVLDHVSDHISILGSSSTTP